MASKRSEFSRAVLGAAALAATAALAAAPGARAQGLDRRFVPEARPTPRTDFDRAIRDAPARARQPDPYVAPSPHDGLRLRTGPNGSIGGDYDPKAGPSANYRRDFR